MAMSGAERQRRYKERLKAAAEGAFDPVKVRRKYLEMLQRDQPEDFPDGQLEAMLARPVDEVRAEYVAALEHVLKEDLFEAELRRIGGEPIPKRFRGSTLPELLKYCY